ncbi:uncharacterized protein LOC120197317 [Hibiscus syriacus]|uniref:uncharacterized protein LOC120197317 n=1 Tax=Hibiscus syriacus TaxID=106335 RepID=UPI0019234F21|nr:uncharacterized protein LOC120197317 [Hibiscus syriacus]
MDRTESESRKEGDMEIHHFSHEHPLMFIQDQSFASETYFPHKRCAELELAPQIDHPFHTQHPLTTLPKVPYEGTCDFCSRDCWGIVYHCAPCIFDLHVNCALLQSSIAADFPTRLHRHPLLFVQNHTEEVKHNCSACKNPLFGPIYHCTHCSLPKFFNLHDKCSNLALEVNHPYDPDHPLSLLLKPTTHLNNCGCYLCKIQWEGFVYSCSLCNFELIVDEYFAPYWMCKICYEEVNRRYGSYSCSNTDCNYIAHVHCATNKAIWDGTIVLEDNDDSCNETLHESLNLITDIIEKTIIGVGYSSCHTCCRPYHGFSYQHDEDCRSSFQCDIQCILLSDTLKHTSHEHSLLLVHDLQTQCSGCVGIMLKHEIAYTCMKHCGSTLHISCVTQPLIAWYKYDKHALTLTYSDDSSPSQHYCDPCENERYPNDWFYYCADCDNSLRSKCTFGDPQFMKLGSKVVYGNHPHPLTVVKNNWNCPPCKVCSNLCNGLALECKEFECNFTIHNWCHWQ